MAEIVPVQVRMDPLLHRRVADLAERLHCSRNAAYQMLIELGFAQMAKLEQSYFPLQVVNG